MNTLIKEYLEHMKLLNKAGGTIKKHEIFLKDFNCFLAVKKITEINDIKQSHIIDYQKYRHQKLNRYNRKDALESQNRYLEVVKTFFKYIKREGYIVYNPSIEIDYIKVPKRLPKPALDFKEFKKLVSQINLESIIGYRDRTIIELFYSSALRRDELRQLKVASIDYEHGYTRVIGKGDKERVVPIGKVACGYLENYIKGIRPLFFLAAKNDHLFLSKRGNQISESAIKTLVKKYSKAAKIKKHVTPHTLRRSAATGMIRNKANVMLVRDLLGHASVEAINSYIDLTIVDLKEAHKKTHPREKHKKA